MIIDHLSLGRYEPEWELANGTKEKAQEIKCHPKALGVQNPQEAARLEDRLKHRGQLTIKKKSWRAFGSSVCY